METARRQAARVEAARVESGGRLLFVLLLVSRLGEVVDPELSAEGGLLAVVDALLAPVTVAVLLATIFLTLDATVSNIAFAASVT